ncbi:MAG TPA: serine/threonine-protein kinase [Anaeromyxobacteraceae bacterium]|nr:serine/threonine-protein kinase [Anaeromyxobacteraceae bacterium]
MSTEERPPGSTTAPCPLCGLPHGALAPCGPSRPRSESGATVSLKALSHTPTGESLYKAVDPLVGTTVGSFRIVRALGRGGMGTVYLAEHPVIGSKVAIKFLHESMAANADLVGRFYDEARAVNLIGHENIVGIFDLALLPPNRYYIVMEYLEGLTLSSMLRSGPVAPAAALDILVQLCDALHCAHERGVVHRDLKPDNVFVLRRRGREHFVKLVDFGIAKLRDAPAGSHTAAGMIVGTPEYMAPEQCDNRTIDARTDVYALGVMAYQLATGRLPFTGTSIAQLLLAHLKEPPPSPRGVNPAVSAGLEAAILRALAKRPEDRFPDMAAFGRALFAEQEALARPAVATPPPSAPPAAATPAVPATPAPSPSPGPRLEVRLPGEAAPRLLDATELTRGGVYLRADPPLPVPMAKAKVSIPLEGGGKVEVDADVVRVVTSAEAPAWKMPPGFALQFHATSTQARAALDRLAGAQRPVAAGAPPDDAAAATLLEDLQARAGASHYEFLGLPPDAELKDVQSRARSLRVELERLSGRKLSPRHAAMVAPLLARVAKAADVVGVPSERLSYDARHGNHKGVARCIAAGLADAIVNQRRSEFLRERPDAASRAQQCLSRARVARAMGNNGFALAQYEEALAADPLNLELHRDYWQLRRDREGVAR